MKNIICIYHSIDLDGFLSAAIVKKKFPDAKLIGWNHGEAIPDVPSNHNVVICDIAFPMEKMDEIATKSESFTWIDHHISSIKKYEEYQKTHPVKWTTNLARNGALIGACELTWKYFMKTAMPQAVKMLGAYDSFRHKGTKDEFDILCFELAAQAEANSPETALAFLTMPDRNIEDMIDEGHIIFNYEKIKAIDAYKQGFPVTFNGKKFIIMNGDRMNVTNYGIDYHKDGYDGSGCFWYDGKIWHFSVYCDNDEIDCSEIAKKYGGGGHRGASGFEPSDKLLLDIIHGKHEQRHVGFPENGFKDK
jgi:oligoribonuclease NrnB/cAMP/cGMP phosphodiesterase (DHH superfamily)